MLRLFSGVESNRALTSVQSTSNKINTQTEKLSSGKRVGSPTNDLAALAIGSRLESEVAALSVATSNAGQAASLLQLTDGSISRVQDILSRMRALAVQAGSQNLANDERALLDIEYQALSQEIDRIARDTEFNGQNVLDAENVAVGLDEDFVEGQNGIVNLTVRNFNNRSILEGGDGQLDFSVEYSASGDTLITTDQFITSDSVGTTTDRMTTAAVLDAFGGVVTPSATAESITVGITSDTTAPLAFAGNTTQSFYSEPSQFDLTVGATQNADPANFIEFTTRFDSNVIAGLGQAGQQFEGGLIIRLTEGLVTGALSEQTSNDSEVILVLDENFTLNPNPALVENPPTTVVPATLLTLTEEFIIPESDVGPTRDLNFKVSSGIDPNESVISTSISGLTLNNLALENLNILTQGNADLVNSIVQDVMDEVSELRATLAGQASRISFAANNLTSTIENTEAARSRLLDLDVAQEISRFTSTQVLQQSGISALAQAESFRSQIVGDLLA